MMKISRSLTKGKVDKFLLTYYNVHVTLTCGQIKLTKAFFLPNSLKCICISISRCIPCLPGNLPRESKVHTRIRLSCPPVTKRPEGDKIINASVCCCDNNLLFFNL